MRRTSAVVLPVPAAASTTSVSSSDDGDPVAVLSCPPARLHGRLLSHSRSRQERLRLARHALLAAGPAHRAELAPRARALGRRRCQRAPFDGAIDRSRALRSPSLSRRASSRTGRCLKPPAEVQKNSRDSADRHAEHRLGHRGVDERLQHAAAADDQRVLGAVLSGLVIRHAQHAGLPVHVDRVDGAPQREAAVDEHRIAARCADRVRRRAAARTTARSTGAPSRRRRRLAEPAAQVARDRRDLLLPDALDGGHHALAILVGHLRDRRLEHLQRRPAATSAVSGNRR